MHESLMVDIHVRCGRPGICSALAADGSSPFPPALPAEMLWRNPTLETGLPKCNNMRTMVLSVNLWAHWLRRLRKSKGSQGRALGTAPSHSHPGKVTHASTQAHYKRVCFRHKAHMEHSPSLTDGNGWGMLAINSLRCPTPLVLLGIGCPSTVSPVTVK